MRKTKKSVCLMIAVCYLLSSLAGCDAAGKDAELRATSESSTGSTTAATGETGTTEATGEATVSFTTAPVVTDPVTTDPVVTNPVVTEPEASDPAVTEPVVPADHKHNYRAVKTTPPSCAGKGYTTYTCDCGASYKDNYTDALSHDYTSKVVDPTSESQGYTLHTCSKCGKTYKDNYTDKLPGDSDCNHEWIDIAIILPTIYEQGYTEYICARCGMEKKDDFVDKLPMPTEPCKEHSYVIDQVYATCQQEGYTQYTCRLCGYSYKDDIVEKGQHWFKFDPDEKKEATYEEAGYEKYKCAYCDYVKVVELPRLEHIDTAALEAYGRRYASETYGYNGTTICCPENGAGYMPGVTWKISTMEQGYQDVRDAIDYQYRINVGAGDTIWEERDGQILRMKINIYFEPTSDPNVFIIWVYYGGGNGN